MKTLAPWAHPVAGASDAELVAAATAAIDQITSLIHQIDAAAPQRRHYYPAGKAAFQALLAERRTLLSALAAVVGDLLALADEDAAHMACRAIEVPALPAGPRLYPARPRRATGPSGNHESAAAIARAAATAAATMNPLAPHQGDHPDFAAWASAHAQHARRVELLGQVGAYFQQLASVPATRVKPTPRT